MHIIYTRCVFMVAQQHNYVCRYIVNPHYETNTWPQTHTCAAGAPVVCVVWVGIYKLWTTKKSQILLLQDIVQKHIIMTKHSASKYGHAVVQLSLVRRD